LLFAAKVLAIVASELQNSDPDSAIRATAANMLAPYLGSKLAAALAEFRSLDSALRRAMMAHAVEALSAGGQNYGLALRSGDRSSAH
jgi:hypothetical protein